MLKKKKKNTCQKKPLFATCFVWASVSLRLLGKWLEAAKDLRLACKLDCDEQAMEWLKEVCNLIIFVIRVFISNSSRIIF